MPQGTWGAQGPISEEGAGGARGQFVFHAVSVWRDGSRSGKMEDPSERQRWMKGLLRSWAAQGWAGGGAGLLAVAGAADQMVGCSSLCGERLRAGL